jgi:hypothetical protein
LLAAPDARLTPSVIAALKHLAEDDSRSVSSAASSALQAYAEKQRAPVAPDRLAKDQRERARAEVDRLAVKAEQDRQARLTAERERIEARIGRVEQPLIQPLAPIGTRPPERVITVRVWSSALLLAVVFGVSWALAFPMFLQAATQLTAIMLAGVTPIVTLAVSLRRSGLPLKWRHFFVIGIGWLAGFVVASMMANGADSNPFRTTDAATKVGVIFGAMCGAAGGTVTGLTLKNLTSSPGSISLSSITLGWAIAWAAGFAWLFTRLATYSLIHKVDMQGAAVNEAALFVGLAGAFIGAVGGGITYQQINRAAH